MRGPSDGVLAAVHLDYSSGGLITALGAWEPPRGRSNGQASLWLGIGAAQKGAG